MSYHYERSKNFAVGFEANYFTSTERQIFQNFINSSNQGSISIERTLNTQSVYGGFFLKNFFEITNKFSFFIKSSIGFGKGRINEEFISSARIPNTKIKYFGVSVNPGIVYFVTPKFSVESSFSSLYFRNTKFENKSYIKNITENDLGLSLNSSTLFLGINYHFK